MAQDTWMKYAEDIASSVTDAINSGDFSGLSNTIGNTVTNIGNTISNRATYGNTRPQEPHGYKDAYDYNQTNASSYNYAKTVDVYPVKNNVEGPINKRIEHAAGQVLNTLLLIVSSVATAGLTVADLTLIPLIKLNLSSRFIVTGVALSVAEVFLIALTFAGISLINMAGTNLGLYDRFKKYAICFIDRDYAPIKVLAEAVGKSEKYVKKDLKRLVKKGYFAQGHFDDQNKTFLITDAAYNDYRDNQIRRYQYEKDLEDIKATKVSEPAENADEFENLPSEIRDVVKEGYEYIRYVKECNNKIPGEVMSKKLLALEDIMKHIFDRLKEQPQSVDDLRKLMKYYLPTTKKLLDAYIELDGKPSYGDNNIANTKTEIENTFDVINEAFGKLFDGMYQDTAWDISSDISTMKTMMAQDGLTGGKDFNYERGQ